MGSLRFAACFLAAFTFLGGALAQAPRVVFTKEKGRNLITVNNPEQLTTVDLGDNNLGNTVIYRDTIRAGAYRNWFEHTNRTGGTIGHAISLVNTGTSPMTVITYGSSFHVGLLGGKPFSGLFGSNPAPVRTTLAAGQRMWLWRLDNAVANNNFFSGVIDFDLDGRGTVQVENIAYRQFSRLTGTRTYMGYIQRVEPDGTRAARQYKGMSAFWAVRTDPMVFVINNSSTGELPVTTADYNLTTQTYGPPVVRSYWISNIGPAQNAQGVTSDMVAWWMPGWGWVDPLLRSDGTNNFPNLGNWGVVYIVTGAVQNTGTFTRTVQFNLRAPAGGGSPIAYQGTDGVWRDTKMEAGQSAVLGSITVPAGKTVLFTYRYVLGGPGAGALRNSISIATPSP